MPASTLKRKACSLVCAAAKSPAGSPSSVPRPSPTARAPNASSGGPGSPPWNPCCACTRTAPAALSEAVANGGLDDTGDPAAVLDWGIDPTGGHSAGVGPLRWLPAVPERLGENPHWGKYLHRRGDLVNALANPLIGMAPELAAEIAVFRAAHRVSPQDSRLVGADQYAARPRTIGRLLHDAAVDAIGRRRPAVPRFRQLIDSVGPRIRRDSLWPQLAAH